MVMINTSNNVKFSVDMIDMIRSNNLVSIAFFVKSGENCRC